MPNIKWGRMSRKYEGIDYFSWSFFGLLVIFSTIGLVAACKDRSNYLPRYLKREESHLRKDCLWTNLSSDSGEIIKECHLGSPKTPGRTWVAYISGGIVTAIQETTYYTTQADAAREVHRRGMPVTSCAHTNHGIDGHAHRRTTQPTYHRVCERYHESATVEFDREKQLWAVHNTFTSNLYVEEY